MKKIYITTQVYYEDNKLMLHLLQPKTKLILERDKKKARLLSGEQVRLMSDTGRWTIPNTKARARYGFTQV